MKHLIQFVALHFPLTRADGYYATVRMAMRSNKDATENKNIEEFSRPTACKLD
jgi:hypothetical protein